MLAATASAAMGAATFTVGGGTAVYSQSFDGMGTSGTATPADWTAQGIGGGGDPNSTAVTGTTVAPFEYTAPPTSFVGIANVGGGLDRALGGVGATATGTLAYQLEITNNTGAPLTSFTVGYTGEQWRRGKDSGANTSVAETLVMRYGATSTSFVEMGAAYNFTTPQVSAASDVYIDGNDVANRVTGIGGTYAPASPIADGATFFLRWTDVNSPSSPDALLAIDDFTIVAAAVPEPASLGLLVSTGLLALRRRRRA
jgi:hypothetical protein